MKLGFGKKKKEDLPVSLEVDSIEASRLRELCGVDSDLYNAMSRLMFVDPTRIKTSLDRVVSEAQGYEAQGNRLRAEIAYRIAGGISLSKGDVAGVEKYFAKAASIASDPRLEFQTLVKKSEAAVAVARKYYEESSSLSPVST